MEIECTVFVYKKIFCTKGQLIIGNNGYEIFYEPQQSKKSTPSNSPRANNTNDNVLASPSLSANSSGFLSFLSHLSPLMPYDDDILHRIVIDWDTISGLQRINKDIEYKEKKRKNSQKTSQTKTDLQLKENETTENENKNKIELKEQLIIESTSYPKLHIMRKNYDTGKYETKSVQPLRTHYIGLEYDLMHSHDILLSNNYQQIAKYSLMDEYGNDEIVNFDDDSITKLSLLDKYPSYSLLLNHNLPAWIWVPLLNHTLRVWIERIILLGNIGLFIWTIYQMTKYTSIIKGFYEHVFYPIFDYISQPILKKIYYILNLMHFHVVLQLCSNIFNIFYNYIPINKLYGIIAFIDQYILQKINQHIIQQIIALFTIIYRLFMFIGGLFMPIINFIISLFKGCFNIINWGWFIPNFDCTLCKRCSMLCDGRCWRFMRMIFKCMRKCCRLCQRSQTLTDSSTKILKAGVQVINNTENTMDANTAWSICNSIRNIWKYCRAIIDIFWLNIGKPIKHSYDFFRYIRSEVGTLVGICIRKCCRKGKEKAIKALKSTRNAHKTKKSNKAGTDLSDDLDTKSEHIIRHNTHFNYDTTKINGLGLRYRGNKKLYADQRSKSQDYEVGAGGGNDDDCEEDNDQKYSAVAAFQYFQSKDGDGREKKH